MTFERNASFPATVTEKTMLPRPPRDCELLSTPTKAENVLPGEGNRTATLLAAWQNTPRGYSVFPIVRGRPIRVFRHSSSKLARTASPHCGWVGCRPPSNFAAIHLWSSRISAEFTVAARTSAAEPSPTSVATVISRVSVVMVAPV